MNILDCKLQRVKREGIVAAVLMKLTEEPQVNVVDRAWRRATATRNHNRPTKESDRCTAW